MDGDTLWRMIDNERATLADVLDDLTPDEWEHPSLCAGWRVQDVAAHLTLAQMRLLPAAAAIARARGSFDGMIRDTALAQAAAVPRQEYAARLRAMAGSRRKAPFISDLEPLLDVLVHGQDMTVPLGRQRPMPVDGARAAATRAWTMGRPFQARRRLAGLRIRATDTDWAVGDGPLAEGPVASVLLVLTGRAAGAAQLAGPGAAEVRRRLAASVVPTT